MPLWAWRLTPHVGLRRGALLGLLASSITHPLLWFAAPRFAPYALWVAVMEIAVVVAEAAIVGLALRRSTPRWLPVAAATSLLANAASFAVGLLLVRLL